ncbi:vesicle transport protein SEC22 [Nematocida homosporus]|uniref:vesicle transport protein SEC22 n=1 Tax=Nematocida homosporus TaxID=1912981 RepID=UPI00221F08D4|nr:vesicle transport protein SEC22 [Nematocida homosporus]KAI5184754.1 vesicle transport protein SEC22 [Nematocida homosporus]
MAILYTQIVRLSDKRVVVSAECPLSRHFESKHKNVIEDMRKVAEEFVNETHFCSTKSSSEDITIYFKQYQSILILAAVEVGLSKTSVSLYFERLRDLFVEDYGVDLSNDGAYIRFEEVIREESRKHSKDKGLEETIDTLQETKEVCIKNYTNVLQRGHKIEQLEVLGQRLQNVSEKFRKRSRKMHIESIAAQYLFYAGLIILLFLVLYFFMRH